MSAKAQSVAELQLRVAWLPRERDERKALDFALSIPHKPVMGPSEPPKEHRKYLREASRSVQFSEPKQRKEKGNG